MPAAPPACSKPAAKPDTVVDECLATTAALYTEIGKRLKEHHHSDLNVKIPRDVLKKWKKFAGRANRAIDKHSKAAYEREDRRIVETMMMKDVLRKEKLDRDANLARVYEWMRSSIDPAYASIDRAIGSAAVIEDMLCELSPTGRVSFHGAEILLNEFKKTQAAGTQQKDRASESKRKEAAGGAPSTLPA